MKKSILLLFVFALSFRVSAQYHQIAKQGRVWYTYVQASWLGNSTMVLEVKGDTLLNGVQYSLLVRNDSIRNNPGQAALILEDTTAGSLTLYEIAGGTLRDTIHYDFSLSQGDTLKVKGSISSQPSNFIADSVFYRTDFNNVQRKVIWLVGADPNTWCHNRVVSVWVEGIGATTYLGYPYPDCNAIIEAGFELKCAFDGNTKIYGDTVSTCYKIGLNEIRAHQLSFYPNPVKNKLEIQSEFPVAKASLFSLNGTLIRELTEVRDVIDVSALKPGIFILEFTDVDGNVGRYKVVKE